MEKTKQTSIKCDFCGKEIEVNNFRQKRSEHHFCNLNCYVNWRKKKISVPCSYCGKNIEIFPLRKRSNNLYCSRNCYYKAKRKKIPSTCEYCGKNIEITPSKKKANNHHFCSRKCHGKWQRKRIAVYCDFCGKEMMVLHPRRKERKHLFCSVPCYVKWQRKNIPTGVNSDRWNRIEIRCDFCNKKIKIVPYRYKSSKNHFCSTKCHSEWQKQNSLGDKNPRWNSEKKICKSCGKDFFVMRSKSKKRFFCCEICFFDWLRKNPRTGKKNPRWNSIETNCDFCGEKIYVTSYRFKTFKNHFCNKSCFDKWSRINKPRGRSSPVWKGGSVPFYGTCWASQKRKILERAKYASEISGNNGGLLDVHHIIPMRNFI